MTKKHHFRIGLHEDVGQSVVAFSEAVSLGNTLGLEIETIHKALIGA